MQRPRSPEYKKRKLAGISPSFRGHGSDGAPGQRFASAEALALYRLNALDSHVKGAFEHQLPAGAR